MDNMKKLFTMSERYVEILKKESKEMGITESDFVRRLLDKYVEEDKCINNIKNFDVRSSEFREMLTTLFSIINNVFEQVKIPKEYKIMFFDTLKKSMED